MVLILHFASCLPDLTCASNASSTDLTFIYLLLMISIRLNAIGVIYYAVTIV
jgi:hypothetical protein